MRLLRILANASLAAQTTLRGFTTDPFGFLQQLNRRLPRVILTEAASALRRGAAGPRRMATAAWIIDETRAARESLGRVSPSDRGRFATRLAQHLELDDSPEERTYEVPDSPGFSPRPWSFKPDKPSDTLAVFHLLTNSLPHTSSGYALRSHHVLLAQGEAGIRIAAATRLGYPVTVGKLRADQSDTIDGITYHRLLPCSLARSSDEQVEQAVQYLVPIVEGFGADVLSTTTDYTNALVAQRVASILGIPWTYEVRGLPEDSWVAQRPTPQLRDAAEASLRYRLLRDRETAAAAAAHHVFTLGPALADDFAKRGIDPRHMSIVRNAAPPVQQSESRDSARVREEFGLPIDGFWVGSISSLVTYEGLDTLIRAVKLSRSSGYDIRLLIVGDGVAKPDLERLATQVGLAHNDEVIFTGRVAAADADRYYRALDLFAIPRQDSRVCRLVEPLKPLQAAAAGIPVIVSDLPALRTFTAHGSSGRVVASENAQSWADTISHLALDTRKIDQLADGARSFARNRTWRQEGQNYRRTHLQLLARGSHA